MEKLLSIFSIILILFSTSCSLCNLTDSDETNSNLLEPNATDTNAALLDTGDSRFEYMIADKNNGMLLYDLSGSYVQKMVARDSSGNWAVMYFDTNGQPIEVVSEGYIIEIGTIIDGKCDIVVINTSLDTISTYNDVDYDFSESSYDRLLPKSIYGDAAKALKMASVAMNTFTVVTAIIGVSTASPLVVALAGVSLGLSVVCALAADELEELEGASLAVEYAQGAIGCGTGEASECVGLAMTVSSTALGLVDEHIEEVSVAEGLINGGSGDIQVTLSWDNTADLDLYVQEPSGEVISYSNTLSATYGQLDIDDQNGYGPENIFWPDNSAPSGEYVVMVDLFSGDPANFTVIIQENDDINQYTGTISSSDGLLEITTFYF